MTYFKSWNITQTSKATPGLLALGAQLKEGGQRERERERIPEEDGVTARVREECKVILKRFLRHTEVYIN